MIREVLFEEYLSLGKLFCSQGDAVETTDCALKAMRLKPDRREPRALLTSLGDIASERSPATPRTPETRRLRRRKRRLDQIFTSDPGLAEGVLDGEAPSREPNDETPRPAAPTRFERVFANLKRRLEADRRQRALEALERLECLAERLALEDVPPDKATSNDDEDDEDGESLSLEHEFHNLGNDFYKVGRLDEALECYNIALDLDPRLLETYFNRGLAYTRLQRYDKAHEDLTKVLELNPRLAEAAYTRGLIEEYRLNFDAAIADYDCALEIDPAYTKAAAQRKVALDKKKSLENPSASGGGSSTSEDRIGDFSAYLCKQEGSFEMVGGNREAKRKLAFVGAYMKGDPAFEEWGPLSPRGVLLYGPSGTGKTLLAGALAAEAGAPFYCTPATVFLNQYYGNTEENLRRLWKEASSHERGAIVFIDEFEALGSIRSDLRRPRGDDCHNKAVACLLDLMDGLQERPSRIICLAATNCLRNIDHAFLRPGRFNYVIEVPAPNAVELAEILLIHLEAAESRAKRADFMSRELREAVRGPREEWLKNASRPQARDASGIVRLARLAHQNRFTGADVCEVVRRCVCERVSAVVDLRVDLGPITTADLETQIKEHAESRRRLALEEQGD